MSTLNYGPAKRRTAAEAKPRSRIVLQRAAEAAVLQLDQSVIPRLRDPTQLGRAKALRGFYKAAATRLAMIGGAHFPFDVEAQGLFSVKPTLKPLSHYDAILARLDKLVPGGGQSSISTGPSTGQRRWRCFRNISSSRKSAPNRVSPSSINIAAM